VFAGGLAELQDIAFAMIRLMKPIRLPEIIRAPLPVRFVIVIVGPQQCNIDYHELGRAAATMMANAVCYDYSTDNICVGVSLSMCEQCVMH
jgi:hypothetical protein